MKRRILPLIACLALALALLPGTALAADEFTIRDGVLISYNWYRKEAVVPEGVTEIGTGAFFNRDTLRKVVLPDSVTVIGDDAFSGCESLKELSLPPHVVSLGSWAFSGCRELTSLTIPDGVTVLPEHVFDGCTRLSEVHLPDGLTEIGKEAFSRCSGLHELELPASYTVVGPEAFHGMSGLKSITIPEGTEVLHKWTLGGCSSLEEVKLPESLKVIESAAFAMCGRLQSLTIPAGVERIEDGGLAYCKNIKKLVFLGGDTDLGADLVGYDLRKLESNLTEVILPEGNGTVDENAFRYTKWYRNNGNKIVYAPAPAQIGPMPEPPRIPDVGTAYGRTLQVLVDSRPTGFYAFALQDDQGGQTNYLRLRDVAAALDGTAAQFDVGWSEGGVSVSRGPYTNRTGDEGQVPFTGDRRYEALRTSTDVDGEPRALAAISLTDEAGRGYTYYQLRDLGKALGFSVKWENNVVTVETDRAYTEN